MRRIRQVSPLCLAVVGLFVLLGTARSGRGADDGWQRQLTDLDKFTGTDPIKGRIHELVADPKGTRKLLTLAKGLARDKKQEFAYNAAYILAEAGRELHDEEACELFYRQCTTQAVKLESTRKLLESFGGLIDLLYEGKKYDAAAKVCRELLDLKTTDAKPRVVLVAISTRFGEPDFVEDESYDTARRLRPGVHRLYIQAIAKQGKYDQALKFVDSLIKAQDHWQERQLRGWVLREAGKFAEAAKTYEDVLERIQQDKELETEEKGQYEDRYRYILSNVYVDLNQVDRAAELLKNLATKHPDEPGYHNDLGYIWADHDMNLEEAEKHIRQALELDRKRRKAEPELQPGEDTDNGAYFDSLGWVLFKQKRYKEAKDVLLKAVEDKASQHIEIFDHLGDTLMALGEREAALNAWRRGLDAVGEGRREQQRRTEVEKKVEKHK